MKGPFTRVSNSFEHDELQMLQQLCEFATQGKDARVLARQKAFARLYEKGVRMKQRAERPLPAVEVSEASK